MLAGRRGLSRVLSAAPRLRVSRSWRFGTSWDGLGTSKRPEAVIAERKGVTRYGVSNGYGFTGAPFHHTFTSFERAMAKWRWGTFGGALPVVPTVPIT